MPRELQEPWKSFLVDLDSLVDHEVQLHCCGGFVVTTLHGLPRATADVDIISVVPQDDTRALADGAKQNSELHRKHGVYLDVVTVASYPDEYETRLIPMDVGRLYHLQLFALEAHDLALTKLERNSDRDRADVAFLATAAPLDSFTLCERYTREMRPYLVTPEREDLTLELWLEIIEEAQNRARNNISG
jgi:hypothetical protein